MILYCFDCGYVRPLSDACSEELLALAESGVTVTLRCPCGCELLDMVTGLPSLQEVPARERESDER